MKFLKQIWFVALAAIISAGFSACSNDDDSHEPSDFDYNDLSGMWMQVEYTQLGAEAGADDKKVNLDAETYKFVRLDMNTQKMILTAKWIVYPSMGAQYTFNFNVEGMCLYDGETLMGTIESSGKSNGQTTLTIIWEKGAEPFNLTPAYRNKAVYWLDKFNYHPEY